MNFPLAFTDGASAGNPGLAGWGTIVATETTVTEYGDFFPDGTNNQAELKAVLRVLRWAQDQDVSKLTVYTDSGYVSRGATSWVHGWKDNGWQTQAGEPVQNQRLWQQLLDLQSGLQANYQRVGGHAGIPANERADEIATAFAAGDNPQLFSGPKAEYTVPLNPDPKRFPDAPRYISVVDGEVREHSSWEACEDRVNGKEAQYRKVETVAQRDQILNRWGKSPEDINN